MERELKRADGEGKRIRGERKTDGLLLLYWPIYLISFYILEHVMTAREFHVMHCPLDDLIPFDEIFILPYISWYPALAAVLLYTWSREREVFRSTMYFLMITFTVSLFINLVWPTCQDLRPGVFEDDNFLTYLTGILYMIDTDTNVCPSMHVTGAMAISFAVWHCRSLRRGIWRTASVILTVLISTATLFIRQHSVIDVAAGLALGLVSYPACYLRREGRSSPGL